MEAIPGDIIELEVENPPKHLVFEDLEMEKLRIVNLTDFEDLEYSAVMNTSTYHQMFEEGKFRVVGHISNEINKH